MEFSQSGSKNQFTANGEFVWRTESNRYSKGDGRRSSSLRAGVKLLAYTDGVGYCAIGPRKKGSHVVIAVSLANRSSAEARNNVLAQLAKAGGVTPKIMARWRDSSARTASK